MKVSVIIPTYNEENYIEKTIFSIKNQDYKNIEIIVVDNGSIDGTLNKLLQISDIKVFKEERRGVQYAREYGRSFAVGDIIANLDADCLPDKSWISRGIKYFKDKDVVAVSGPYRYYDANIFFRFISIFIQKVFYRSLHFLGLHIFHRGVIVMGGNIMIRTETLKKIGGYNTSIFFYGDDTDTGNRLLSVGKVLYKNNMIIDSSSRRFKRFGFLKVFWKYIINFIWVVIFQRPFNKKYDVI